MSIFNRKSTITPIVNHHPEPVVTNPPVTSVPSGVKIKGCDIYHGDEFSGWNKLIDQGLYFMFMKATEGTGHKDSKFHEYWALAKAHGIIRGAYHFFKPDQDPVDQAEFFYEMVGPLEDTDLPMVLDLEYADGNPNSSHASKARAFLEKIELLSKKIPILYTNKYIIDYFNNPSWVSRYPLWIPNYSKNPPPIPSPYKRWTFFQYTESGTPVSDLNLFNGSLDELKAFIKLSKIT